MRKETCWKLNVEWKDWLQQLFIGKLFDSQKVCIVGFSINVTTLVTLIEMPTMKELKILKMIKN